MSYVALSHHPTARLREGVPDIRGFEVRTRADDARVGRVADVIVDLEGHPHFVDVDVGGLLKARHVLLPATRLQVDAPGRLAWVLEMGKDEVKHLPDYDQDPSRLADAPAATAPATMPVAVPATPAEADEVRRVTLAAEELSIGRRTVQAGEVELRTTVETQRVQRTVALMHEDVTVERRAVEHMDAATAQIEVTEDEIRIPIFSEEVVVEKRVVAREEFIVRKRQVTETRTVEADVRRERLDIDQSDGRP
jgi:uncharacterized protein (TIGR02271 family)